jgi:hypothetical protein
MYGLVNGAILAFLKWRFRRYKFHSDHFQCERAWYENAQSSFIRLERADGQLCITIHKRILANSQSL